MKNKFKRISTLIVFIFPILLSFNFITNDIQNNPKINILTSSSYKIDCYENNNQEYLSIKAKDHYALGIAIGTTLLDRILLLDQIIQNIITLINCTLQDFYVIASTYFIIPSQYTDYIQGVSDTTGISYDNILLQFVWIDILYGIILPMNNKRTDVRGCTGVITSDNVAINFDLMSSLSPTLTWILYRVKKNYTVFSLYCGAATGALGINSKGLAITNLLHEVLIPSEVGAIPSGIKGMYSLENLATANEATTFFLDTYTMSSSLNIIDKEFALATEDVKLMTVTEFVNDYRISTNDFRNEYMKTLKLIDYDSVNSQNRAELLAFEAYVDDEDISLSEIIDIMKYRSTNSTGQYLTDDSISIYPPLMGEVTTIETLAFFIVDNSKKKSSILFGLGNPADSSFGNLVI